MATVKFYYEIEIEDDEVLEYNDWKEDHLIEDEDYVEVAENILNNRMIDEGICAENFEHEVMDIYKQYEDTKWFVRNKEYSLKERAKKLTDYYYFTEDRSDKDFDTLDLALELLEELAGR